MRLLTLTITFLLYGSHGALAETVYEKNIYEARTTVREEDITPSILENMPEVSRELILKKLHQLKWGEEVIKVALLPERNTFKVLKTILVENKIMRPFNEHGEIIFQRKIGSYERTYGLFDLVSAGSSADDLKVLVQSREWDEKTFKVELFRGATPFIRIITVIGENLLISEKCEAWRVSKPENLCVILPIPEGYSSSVSQEADQVSGRVFQKFSFTTKGGMLDRAVGSVSCILFEYWNENTRDYQFRGDIIRSGAPYSLKKTDVGNLIQLRFDKFEASTWYSKNKRLWITNANGAKGQELYNLLINTYLKRYPSEIDPNYVLDPKQWAQELIKDRLKDAHENIERGYQVNYALNGVRQNLYVPLLEYPDLLGRDLPDEPMPIRVQKVEKWWNENKDKVHWSTAIKRLVIEGNTPEDLALMRKAEIERIRTTPMSPEEIEAAKKLFPAAFEKALAGDRGQDKFTKVNNTWTVVYESGAKFSYVGLEFIIIPNEHERPLRAEFKRIINFPEGKIDESKGHFDFNRVAEKWEGWL